MKNINSLKNEEFKMIYANGKSLANKYLIMYVYKEDEEKKDNVIKLGISVSKKVGNSIVRHRITRLIREAYRLNKEVLIDRISIVVIARSTVNREPAIGYDEIESAFLHLCRMHHILA